jgi:GNAT superfamily N-acetyltransferase
VPDEYRIRAATLDDLDALVRHRLLMFADMGVALDADAIDRAFRSWLAEMLPAGVYRGWVVDVPDRSGRSRGTVVAGGGITILPWPPGPRDVTGRLAFVYNVYTEREHRRRGLARLIMDAIHDWCREAGIASVALNASADGQPLYEAMGYQAAPNPMMFFPVLKV